MHGKASEMPLTSEPIPFAWSGRGPANNGRTDNALRIKELLEEFGFGTNPPDMDSTENQTQIIANRLDCVESGRVELVSGRDTLARIRAKIAEHQEVS